MLRRTSSRSRQRAIRVEALLVDLHGARAGAWITAGGFLGGLLAGMAVIALSLLLLK